MTREDLNSIETKLVGEELEKKLKEFKEEISKKNDKEELESMEQDLMKTMNEYDEYLKNVKYELPKFIKYNDITYSNTDISNRIVSFLNKLEVEFSYVLGLYQLSYLWRNTPSELDYHKYDSTLRCLGQVKYKGYKEWGDIIAINEYMSSCHDAYTKDTTYFIYLSQLHNAILDRMQLIETLPSNEVELKEDQSYGCEENCECEEKQKKIKKNTLK